MVEMMLKRKGTLMVQRVREHPLSKQGVRGSSSLLQLHCTRIACASLDEIVEHSGGTYVLLMS